MDPTWYTVVSSRQRRAAYRSNLFPFSAFTRQDMTLHIPSRFLNVSLIGLMLGVVGVNAPAASLAPVAAQHGMVVTAQHLATEVGVDILRKGGNAIDAAVAVGYALAVVYPAAGNLGGGGFMTVSWPMVARHSSIFERRHRLPRLPTCT